CEGIPRRALPAGVADPAHRPDLAAAHPQLHRREGAGHAEVILRCDAVMDAHSLIRHSGARVARAMMRNCASENPYSRWWLWIPGLRLAAHPGMTAGGAAP